MSISGIEASGYSATGHKTKKTERNMTEGNFARQVAEAAQAAGEATATLHGADEGSRDITVSSWADVVNGASVSVYKTPDFAPENPVYKVKTWDKSGNVTEQMADVSKVDPKN